MDQAEAESSENVEERYVSGGRWIGWLVIVLAMVGLGICLYLYSLHMGMLLGKIESGLLCGAGNGLGCHAVTSGSYNSIMGISLASWGALFYIVLVLLGFGGLIFYKDRGQAFFRWAFTLAVAGLVFDLYLGYLMIFEIRAVCGLCISTYAVNMVLAITLALQVLREPKPRVLLRTIFPGMGMVGGANDYYREVVKTMLFVGMVVAMVIVLGGSRFLSQSLTKDDRGRLARIIQGLSQQQPKIIAAENRPAMGAEDSKVLVIEYSDFKCPFCTQASKFLKLSAKDTQDFARFVFRHYPLDKRCNRRLSSDMHPGACLLAESSSCADEQNKFWEFHDIAFETKGNITQDVVLKIASDIGLDIGAFEDCMNNRRGLKVVVEDIQDAIDAGIRSTPTLIINGRIMRGVPKPWMLNEILRYAEKNFPIEDLSGAKGKADIE
jgi:protein-disulfide isomerase/uncharacterized membrane protein